VACWQGGWLLWVAVVRRAPAGAGGPLGRLTRRLSMLVLPAPEAPITAVSRAGLRTPVRPFRISLETIFLLSLSLVCTV
jgi:hypothetical protein